MIADPITDAESLPDENILKEIKLGLVPQLLGLETAPESYRSVLIYLFTLFHDLAFRLEDERRIYDNSPEYINTLPIIPPGMGIPWNCCLPNTPDGGVEPRADEARGGCDGGLHGNS
jgi:hypothetical protein